MENLLAGKFFCESMQVMQKHEDTGSRAHVDPNEADSPTCLSSGAKSCRVLANILLLVNRRSGSVGMQSNSLDLYFPAIVMSICQYRIDY